MTNQSWGLTILRVIVGIVFLVHGAQKVFVNGIHGTIDAFIHMGIPLPGLAGPVIAFIELLGGIALILGVATRWAALLIAIDMAGAILLVHLKNGFSMQHMGYEYALTLLGANLALALSGPGAAALDAMLGKKAG
jgi:putative oxidoreductase